MRQSAWQTAAKLNTRTVSALQKRANRMNSILEVNHLSFAYGSQPILSDVSFSLKRGDFTAIIGVNGAGKSTLMKLLLGELMPQQGEIKLFGQELSQFHSWSKIGYVPQNGTAASENFPATAEEIVRANLYSQTGFLHFFGKRQREQTRKALEAVNMLPYAKRMLSELSGGQQQRVMLARVLAANPQMMLLDEPTTGVDAQTVQALYELLAQLNREIGLTIIMITHDIAGAMDTVNRVFCLEEGSLLELNHQQLHDEAKHRHKHPIPPKQVDRTY